MQTTPALRKMTNKELIEYASDENCMGKRMVRFELIRRLENLTVEYENLLIAATKCTETLKCAVNVVVPHEE